MGVVHLAEQLKPVRRPVALKVIKPGIDDGTIWARFEAERQALARMEHPSIARVYDAGRTVDGRSYLAMEYIAGPPLTQYCDDNRLTITARLLLFAQTCLAVQHAHEKGIVHRDLKPSNILVATVDGHATPKIIDFGVAKAITGRLTERALITRFGTMIGTPEYMSPEQADACGGDIDFRADVYSLGVVLYELLVGALPFEFQDPDTTRRDKIARVVDGDVPRPSTRFERLGAAAQAVAERRQTTVTELTRHLRADLDWICIKALEKDRERRYVSPGKLAADVQRFARNDPSRRGRRP